MSNKSHPVFKKLLSWLTSVSIIAMTLVVTMPIPVANAAPTTSVLLSARFREDGLAAHRNNLLVTFTEPVCGNSDCTAGLSVSNFTVTTDNGTGMQFIMSVVHTAGTNWALLIMNADSEATDTGNTIMANEVYTPSGMLLADSTVTTSFTRDTTAPTVSAKRVKTATDDIILQFSEPVSDEQGTGAALVTGDFAYTDVSLNNAASLDAITYTGDATWVYLSTNANVDTTADAADTLGPTDNKIYDMLGNEWVEAATAISTFTADSTAPAISSAYAMIGEDATGGNDLVYLTFSEPVFNANTASGNLADTDFAVSAGTISTVTHTAGNAFAIMDLAANKTSMGTVDGQGGSDDIFDAFGNALAAGTTTTIDDNTMPVLQGVWINQFIDHANVAPTSIGTNILTTVALVTAEASTTFPTEGANMLKMTDGTGLAADEGFMAQAKLQLFDTTNDVFEYTQVKFDAYFEDSSGAITLDDNSDIQFVINDAANFTTASQWAITTDLPEKTWTTVTIDLTAAVTEGTALTALTTNPIYWGIAVNATTDIATSDVLYIDNVRFSRGASSNSNRVILEYSESVNLTGDPAVGASAASTTSMGDMQTNKALGGFGAFASGTYTTKAGSNTVTKNDAGNTYTIDLAIRQGGLITSASPVTLSGLFTPTATVTDVDGNIIAVTSTMTPQTVIDTLDVTTAATAVTNFNPALTQNGTVKLEWTAPSQTAATFSHYVVTYGTSASVSVASSLWDDSNDAALATATTATTTVTGLTNGTTYYFNIAAVDIKGIPTSFVTERNATAGETSATETTAPGLPTGIAATVNGSGKVVLTWTDPTDGDLSKIEIAKSTGTGVDPSSMLASIDKGVKTYTDNNVKIGDVVNYKLRAIDTNDNRSSFTAVTSITVSLTPASDDTVADDTTTDDTVTNDTADDTTTNATVALTAVGDSGVTADASFTEAEDGSLGVDITPTGTNAAMTYPAHIHSGTCAEAGDIKYPLTNVVNNASHTDIADKTWTGLLAEGPLYINIHKSEAEIGVILACGELPTVEEAAAAAEEEAANETADDTGAEADDTVAVPFKDITTHWAKDFITELYTAGVVKSATAFNPDNDITRGEFTKMVMEAFDIEKGNASTTAFSDVKNHWAAAYADGAKKAGLINGYSDGTFKPDAKINRAEAMKILLEATSYEKDAAASGFKDVKAGDWFAVYVNYAVKAKIVSGFSDNTFRPQQNMTRGEVAKVIVKVLGM
ncbi:S-layer homology domain-containing protein [Candidatus Peregrinibacteria bacterium]|nr:S-layer homology domain-containing protein [Candidatus Peregrinibacteria bacterium]